MELHDSPSSGDELESNLKKKSLLKKCHISDSESDADDKAGDYNCSNSTTNVWEINEPIKVNEDHIDESDNTYKKKVNFYLTVTLQRFIPLISVNCITLF